MGSVPTAWPSFANRIWLLEPPCELRGPAHRAARVARGGSKSGVAGCQCHTAARARPGITLNAKLAQRSITRGERANERPTPCELSRLLADG